MLIFFSGDLIISDRIDYEELENKQLTFDLAVYDAGVPQFSAMASVVVNIENLNDESPIFELPQGYSVSIPENSPAGKEFCTTLCLAFTLNARKSERQIVLKLQCPKTIQNFCPSL